ncbi:hypothetical protein GCM10009700_31440 [Brevibacterium sanguinis]
MLEDGMAPESGQDLPELAHALPVPVMEGVEKRPSTRMGERQENRVVIGSGHERNNR